MPARAAYGASNFREDEWGNKRSADLFVWCPSSTIMDLPFLPLKTKQMRSALSIVSRALCI